MDTTTNQRNPEQKQRLYEKRQQGPLILKNCLKLIQVQRQELDGQSGMGPDCQESHAGGEQPLRALSWQEPTVRKMLQLCGDRFCRDGCQFGLRDSKTNQFIQKPWGWFNSLKGVRESLSRTCDHRKHQQHAHPTGRDLAATATYPQALCRTFAKALVAHKQQELENCIHSTLKRVAFCRHEETVFSNEVNDSGDGEPEAIQEPPANDASEEDQDDQERNSAEPNSEAGPEWDPQNLMQKLRTVHANLGHPSNQVMVRMLRDARASEALIQKAQTVDCPQCRQRGHARPHRTSQIPSASKKWDVVSVATFWWHSPHKDEKGNPKEHVIGVSWLDEASDFHTATIIRTGTRTQSTLKGSEFQEAFSKEWLRVVPKPGCLRFDDEGAFRDRNLLSWLEGQAIRVNVTAGEAAWQVGKHSRHLEVLKENMSLLSLELGEHVKATELLSLSLAAKNEMHNVRGYSPNQWCFGQSKDRVQSYLQYGHHLPTQSMRETETFEESVQRAEKAQRTFLQADSRRRIHRAAKGKARRQQEFQEGQLVYYYRKGRNYTAKHEAGWHGPARVVAVEKQGNPERNQTQGSVIWIVHAAVLYRCAPEQLRPVPKELTDTYEAVHGQTTPFEDMLQAGNQASYRDISQQLSQEPEDSEIHDEDPTSLGSQRPSASIPHRLFGKQAPRHERPEPTSTGEGHQGCRAPGFVEDDGGTASSSSSRERAGDGARPMQQHPSGAARTGEGVEREAQRERSPRGLHGQEIPDLDDHPPSRQPEVRQPARVHPTREMSSSKGPPASDSQNATEWTEVMSQPVLSEDPVSHRVRTEVAIETTQVLKEQVTQLQEANNQQQQILYQAMVQISHQKEMIEELNKRLMVLEGTTEPETR